MSYEFANKIMSISYNSNYSLIVAICNFIV